MITEKGIVIKTEDSIAWVKTVRTGECESCSAKGTCFAFGGANDMEIEAINAAGASVGDNVLISIKAASVMKASLLVYLFPIISMIAGAFVGQEYAPAGADVSVSSAIGALITFSAAFIIVRIVGKKMEKNEKYRAKIVRITSAQR